MGAKSKGRTHFREYVPVRAEPKETRKKMGKETQVCSSSCAPIPQWLETEAASKKPE